MPGPLQNTQPSAAKNPATTVAGKRNAAVPLGNGQLKKVCQDFESIFIQYMMKQMRQTIPRNGLLGGGSAEHLYTSMLDGKMAENISQQRGIGLAPVLYRQLAAAEGLKPQK